MLILFVLFITSEISFTFIVSKENKNLNFLLAHVPRGISEKTGIFIWVAWLYQVVLIFQACFYLSPYRVMQQIFLPDKVYSKRSVLKNT